MQTSTEPASHPFKIVKPHVVRQIYKLLYIIDKVLQENKIEYWMSGGTLLGAIRSKGLISWDDDADIELFDYDEDRFTAMKYTFLKYGITIVSTWFGHKLFFDYGSVIKGCNWLYPSVDVFIVKKTLSSPSSTQQEPVMLFYLLDPDPYHPCGSGSRRSSIMRIMADPDPKQ